MQRREFITILGGAAAGLPFSVRAQQASAKVFRVGFLGLTSADAQFRLRLWIYGFSP